MTGDADRRWSSLALSLLVARWLVPTEAAARGETLLIATLSVFTATVWLWLAWRRGRKLRWGRADLAWVAIVGTQVLSGLITMVRPANVRSAINLTCEWMSIGCVLLLFRQTVAADQRDWLLRSVVGLMASLSLFGIWQNQVWYPSIAAEFAEFEKLADDRDANRLTDPARLAELERSLGPEAAAADAATRAALRQRVVFSTEPIGFFALANSFATGLMVAFILLASAAWHDRRAVTVGILAPVAFALLLTKSRTAFVGTAAGLLVLALQNRRSLSVPGRRAAIGLGLGLITATGAIALLLGGLDLEVLTEAPKSLLYRLEYWVATGQLLTDSPWLGSGLGQFRNAYLRYKLPGASEAVADPHNWLLEAWAEGGLLGFVAGVGGVGWLLTLALPGRTVPKLHGSPAPNPAVGLGLVAAFVLAAASGANVVTVGCVLLGAAGFSMALRRSSFGPNASLAAGIAIAVHLLGAGGWGMPAIVLLWLVVLTVDAPGDRSTLVPAAAAAVGGVILILVGLVGLRPHYARLSAEAALGRDLARGRSPRTALEAVAAADRFDPAGFLLLASLTSEPVDDRLAAIEAAIARDPGRAASYQLQAELLKEAGRNDDAAAAATDAVRRYPNSARMWATLSEVVTGAERRQATGRAIELDNAMRRAGHLDKVLPVDLRERMEARLSEPRDE